MESSLTRNALHYQAFDKMIFRKTIVFDKILQILKYVLPIYCSRDGHRTNFLLNVLVLTDISIFKIKHLQKLMEVLNGYVTERMEKNSLLLCANPILAICLAAELTDKIRVSRRLFENDCKRIKLELLKLGNMYTMKLQDEKYYEKLIMDKDITGRSVLKIITENKFELLMDENDPKAESVMLKVWNGSQATKCDGDIYDFSAAFHILYTKPKVMTRKVGKMQLTKAFTNFFQPNLKVDYNIQYKYRIRKISFFFLKDFVCSFLLLGIFQYINYKYLNLFNVSYEDAAFYKYRNENLHLSDQEAMEAYEVEQIRLGLNDYTYSIFYSVIFCTALLLQIVFKLIFNLCTRGKKTNIDKWTILDTLCGITNLGAVLMLTRIQAEDLIKPEVKDIADYYMIFVLAITWLRFFFYFLVVRHVSKLLLTLIAMLLDTLGFIMLAACYLLIMASVFTTLYQDIKTENYGNILLSCRTMFDAILATYDYENTYPKELSYSILMICHVLFSHVILLNYLIAILTLTYEKMKQSGVFHYKCNLFQYCERYLIAFEDPAYGQIIVHPAPLNFAALLLLPAICNRKVS